jgi:hypothetical protein
MTESLAKKISIGMMLLGGFLAFHYVFIEQDIMLALFSISAIFTFSFGLENPKLLLSSSWKEFGERVDVATGKEKITGSPWYYATVFFAVLYIILV